MTLRYSSESPSMGSAPKKKPEAEASLVCVKRASASGGTSANCATTLSVHLISQAFLF